MPHQTTGGWILGCSTQGANHQLERPQLPNQDAFSLRLGEINGQSYIIMAVADGHGDKKHDCSHIGARRAAQAACTVLERLVTGRRFENLFHLRTALAEDFPRLCLRAWKAAVLRDARRLRSSLPSSSCPDEKINLSRYGTTLLAALAIADLVFVAQLGDGDAVWVDNQGRSERLPAAGDGLLGGETLSLAALEAHTMLTHFRPLAETRLLALSTDGLSQSYAEEAAFFRFLQAIVQQVDECGLEPVGRLLPATFTKFSRQAKGDDITLLALGIDRLPILSAHSILEEKHPQQALQLYRLQTTTED